MYTWLPRTNHNAVLGGKFLPPTKPFLSSKLLCPQNTMDEATVKEVNWHWQSNWAWELTLSFFILVFEVQTGNCKRCVLSGADTDPTEAPWTQGGCLPSVFKLCSGYIFQKSHHGHRWLVLLNQNFKSLGYSCEGRAAWNIPWECYEEAGCRVSPHFFKRPDQPSSDSKKFLHPKGLIANVIFFFLLAE